MIPSSAIAGNYRSELYGTLEVNLGADSGNMTIGLGPDKYPGNLTHWTNNTWYLSFPNPDDQVGYFTITENTPGAVNGFTSEEFGRFTRV